MKQQILLLPIIGFLLFILQTNVLAQDYLPFPKDSAVWYSVKTWSEPFPPPPVWYNSHKFEAKGDTIINSTLYTKLYWNDTDYTGAYRIDSIYESVYFIDATYGTESLLYDFSLVPGDTIIIQLDGMPEPSHLVCLDTSTMIINNTPHQSYDIYSYLSNGTECYTTWVKGIGSLRMPLETDWFCAGLFETHYNLTCFFYEDVQIYEWAENPYFEGCIGTNVGIGENQDKISFAIVPNPVSSTSHLVCNISYNTLISYEILNVSGKILQSAINIKPINITIQNRDFPRGVFLLRLYTHNANQYYSIKFIIN